MCAYVVCTACGCLEEYTLNKIPNYQFQYLTYCRYGHAIPFLDDKNYVRSFCGSWKKTDLFVDFASLVFMWSIHFWFLGFHIYVSTGALEPATAVGTLYCSPLFMNRFLAFISALVPSLVPNSAEASSSLLTYHLGVLLLATLVSKLFVANGPPIIPLLLPLCF